MRGLANVAEEEQAVSRFQTTISFAFFVLLTFARWSGYGGQDIHEVEQLPEGAGRHL